MKKAAIALTFVAVFGFINGAARLQAQGTNESPTDESRRSFLERARDAFEGEGRRWRPVVAIFVPGSGLAGGVTLESPTSPVQPFGASVESLISMHNYQQVTVRAGMLAGRRDLPALRALDSSATSAMDAGDHHAQGLALFVEHRYRRLPGLSLFGVDGDALVRTDFGVLRNTTDLVLQWKRSPSWGLSGRMGLMSTETFPGTDSGRPNTIERFGAVLEAGRPNTSRFLTTGLGFVVDRRVETPKVRAGWLVQMSSASFISSGPEWASFARFNVDARAYQPLGSTRHILAARLVASADRAANGKPVPYFLQQFLGGSSSLRSFPSYRFRAEQLVHLTLESRWQVHKRVDLVPFVDMARLGDSPLDQDAPAFIGSIGVGARFRHEGKTVGRVEFASGREGSRIIFAVDSPF